MQLGGPYVEKEPDYNAELSEGQSIAYYSEYNSHFCLSYDQSRKYRKSL